MVCLPNLPETEAFHPGVSSGEVEVEGILLHSLLPAPIVCYTVILRVATISRENKKLLSGGCPPARLGSAHAWNRLE